MSDYLTDPTPADLARFVHLVPEGATIPAGMKYVEFYRLGGYLRGPFAIGNACAQACDAPPRWTAEPLTAPKPPLPTEPGSVIVDVVTVAGDRYIVGILTPAGRATWLLIDTEGDDYEWAEPEHIAAFAPARIVKESGDE